MKKSSITSGPDWPPFRVSQRSRVNCTNDKLRRTADLAPKSILILKKEIVLIRHKISVSTDIPSNFTVGVKWLTILITLFKLKTTLKHRMSGGFVYSSYMYINDMPGFVMVVLSIAVRCCAMHCDVVFLFQPRSKAQTEVVSENDFDL